MSMPDILTGLWGENKPANATANATNKLANVKKNNKPPAKNLISRLHNKSENKASVDQTIDKLKTVIEEIVARQEKFEKSNEPPPFVKMKSIETTLNKLLNVFNKFLEILGSKNKPPIKKEQYKELLTLIETFRAQLHDLHPRNEHGRFVHVNAPASAPVPVKKPYLGKKPWPAEGYPKGSANNYPKGSANKHVQFTPNTATENKKTNKYPNSNTKHVPKNSINEVLGL